MGVVLAQEFVLKTLSPRRERAKVEAYFLVIQIRATYTAD